MRFFKRKTKNDFIKFEIVDNAVKISLSWQNNPQQLGELIKYLNDGELSNRINQGISEHGLNIGEPTVGESILIKPKVEEVDNKPVIESDTVSKKLHMAFGGLA